MTSFSSDTHHWNWNRKSQKPEPCAETKEHLSHPKYRAGNCDMNFPLDVNALSYVLTGHSVFHNGFLTDPLQFSDLFAPHFPAEPWFGPLFHLGRDWCSGKHPDCSSLGLQNVLIELKWQYASGQLWKGVRNHSSNSFSLKCETASMPKMWPWLQELYLPSQEKSWPLDNYIQDLKSVLSWPQPTGWHVLVLPYWRLELLTKSVVTESC